jgi:hypothetical protein
MTAAEPPIVKELCPEKKLAKNRQLHWSWRRTGRTDVRVEFCNGRWMVSFEKRAVCED